MNTHLVFDELSVALHYSLQQKTKNWLLYYTLIGTYSWRHHRRKHIKTDTHWCTRSYAPTHSIHADTHSHTYARRQTQTHTWTHTHAVTNLHTHAHTSKQYALCNYAIIHGEHAINLTNYSSKIYIVNGIYRHLVIGVRNWWRWWHILHTNIQVYMKLNYSYMFDCMFMFVQCSLHSI